MAADPTATVPTTAEPKADRPIAAIISGDIHLLDPADGEPTEPVTQHGQVREVQWAPGGDRLVFSAGNGNAAELYLHDVETDETRQVTDNDVYDGLAAWSPDGQWFAFTRGELPADYSDDMFSYAIEGEIWRMTDEGEEPTQLAEGKAPAWAPDSERIAFVTNGVPGDVGQIRTDNEVHLINRQGENEWTLLRLSDLPEEIDLGGAVFTPSLRAFGPPTWTGGGRAVALPVWGSIPLVVSITDQRTGLTVVAASYEGGVGAVRGLGQGRLIAYELRGPSGVRSVEIAPYQAPVSESGDRVTIGGPQAGFAAEHPAWSPAGDTLAVAADAGTDAGVRIYTTSGELRTTLADRLASGLAWR